MFGALLAGKQTFNRQQLHARKLLARLVIHLQRTNLFAQRQHLFEKPGAMRLRCFQQRIRKLIHEGVALGQARRAQEWAWSHHTGNTLFSRHR